MKNNLLANGIMVLIGILLLIAAIQMLGIGNSIGEMEAQPFDQNRLPSLEQAEQENEDGVDEDHYTAITASPLFNNDRLPYVPSENPDGDLVVEEAVETSPLNVKVTSIVITPEKSFVMLQDKSNNRYMTLKQGMPLEGEQGNWFVDQIEPRLVTFAADDQEPVELELEVFSQALKATGRTNNRNNKGKNNRNAKKQADLKPVKNKKNSAEEIRKKIAERRAQMRADAANRKQ